MTGTVKARCRHVSVPMVVEPAMRPEPLRYVETSKTREAKVGDVLLTLGTILPGNTAFTQRS